MVTGKIKPTRASSGLHTLKHSATNSADVFIIQDAKRIAILYGIVLYCCSGASNTLCKAVAAPTESGVLSCPELKFSLWLRLSDIISFGQGASTRKGGGMALHMLLTPSPILIPLVRCKGGCQSRKGDRS